MIPIDLVTGFLGSGKTTFIREYASRLIRQGLRVGILENDYGAVNVDMMLLQELPEESCGLEMVAGGCDADCHRRRFKTKLIAMGMSGYDRVIIEPSGIFDVDEFFDVLHEEPLDRWYEIGNVFAIVDAHLPEELSPGAEYLLASQTAEAGLVLMSRVQQEEPDRIESVIRHLNRAMKTAFCPRRFGEDVFCREWDRLTEEDWKHIETCGWHPEDFRKVYADSEEVFSSRCYLNPKVTTKELGELVPRMMADPACGHVIRVKGFLPDSGMWTEINAVAEGMTLRTVPSGQAVLIVIGEDLQGDRIDTYLGE